MTERFPFAALERITAPGSVVFDVGANIGLYTRFLHSLGSPTQIVAFEPWLENVAILHENLQLAGIRESTIVVPAALGDRDGTVAFQVDDIQSTSGTLESVTDGAPAEGRRNLGLPARSQDVPCHRLDTLLANADLPAPDVLKLDVEGAEGHVLRGAHDTLRRDRPFLLIELHGVSAVREVVGLLEAADYVSFAAVEPVIHASGFGPITSRHVAGEIGRYDVKFIVAAHRERPTLGIQSLQALGGWP